MRTGVFFKVSTDVVSLNTIVIQHWWRGQGLVTLFLRKIKAVTSGRVKDVGYLYVIRLREIESIDNFRRKFCLMYILIEKTKTQ